jgi:Flp pilus assembly pilin Flp
VSSSIARIRVDSTTSAGQAFPGFHRALRALEMPKGGESMFTDLIHNLRARFQVEEGQTMAEYGVVLAVITVLIVGALLALSGAIEGAINAVTGVL